MNRFFLLSPARSGGKRAAILCRVGASFELARQVQIGAARLGNVFAFCSGLYFRGKLTYAQRFAGSDDGVPRIHIITPSRGLLPPDTPVGTRDLAEFAAVPVDSAEPRFFGPLRATAAMLTTFRDVEVILLGSIATGKYLDTLLPIFGERLRFPKDFTGRGDMSRGALLLRAAAAGQELDYEPVPAPPVRKRQARAGPPQRRSNESECDATDKSSRRMPARMNATNRRELTTSDPPAKPKNTVRQAQRDCGNTAQ